MSIYATLWEIKIYDPKWTIMQWDEEKKVQMVYFGLQGKDGIKDKQNWEQHDESKDWIEVCAQAVPPHIGHPSAYPKGDPYSDFLPPVSEDYNPMTGVGTDRAVLIIQQGRGEKEGQRYLDPLFVFTGKAYLALPFWKLMAMILEKL